MSRPASRSPVSEGTKRHPELGIALGLALGPAVAIGLARFAYALLLPSMRTALHWSFATAGAMNTANALGYLAGALAAAPMARRYGSRRAFLASLAVTAVSLLATAASADVGVLVGLRLLAGVSGAVGFITGAGLVAQLGSGSSPRRATLLLGIYFAGGGAGIVVSGLAVPALLAAAGAGTGWRWGWALLGALSLLALGGSTPAALASREPPAPPAGAARWPARRLAALLACYGLFGAGYIAYMTFIVAFLKGEGAGTIETTGFWVVLGVAATTGGFAWAPVVARLRGGRSTAAVMAVITVGALLPLLSSSVAVTILSAVLFGASFLTVVTAITLVARRSLLPHHWTPAIAALTVAFALGQCTGPILAGVLSDGPAGLRIGLGLSPGVLAAGALVALAQRHHAAPVPSVTAGNASAGC